MKVKRFELKNEFKIINGWLEKRGLPTWSEAYIPVIGFSVYAPDDPVLLAVGFLRMCEGAIGLFDSLVSDPDIDFNLRNEAVDLIVGKIIEKGVELNLTCIIGLTFNEHVVHRAVRHGFVDIGADVIILDLDRKKL